MSTHASKTSVYEISIESLDEDGPREMTATKFHSLSACVKMHYICI